MPNPRRERFLFNQIVTTAVILAAGRGTRMGALTAEIPKPMLPIRGRPMLEIVLERLAAAGIERFLIVIGYGGETIRTHFEKTNPNVGFVWQNPVDGTASGALLARSFCGDQPFLLTYGDILCDPAEYRQAVQTVSSNSQVTAAVAVKAVDDPWQGAAVYETAGRITRIVEKPPRGTSTTHWNSAGFYVFRLTVFRYLAEVTRSPRGEYELTSALDAMLADGLDLRISPIEGDWRDVGRPDDLAALKNN